MKNRTPVICDRCRAKGYLGEEQFSALKPVLDFAPVPRRRKRHDGWTPERQRGFIEALARTGSVTQAAAAVNMAKEGAYQLRLHPEAGEFNRAWEAALDYGVRVLHDNSLDRATHGVPIPIMHEGRQVAERRVFNERLTMWHLQHRMPDRFGSNIGAGTRSPATRAREAAEADSGERFPLINELKPWGDLPFALVPPARQEQLAEQYQAKMVDLCTAYLRRVTQEREARLAGEVFTADFYLRQLTHFEILIVLGGYGSFLVKIANGAMENKLLTGRAEAGDEIEADEITVKLDRLRRKAWAKAGEPDRPKIDLPWRRGPNNFVPGEALAAARARAAAAQKEWEEAVAEQAWILRGAREAEEAKKRGEGE